MVGGSDDFVTRISTQSSKKAPRDNVYLEYGLFSGMLSPNKVLLLINSECVPASDLAGLSLAQYSDNEQAVELAKSWIGNSNQNKILTGKNIELLPTVGIAVGYYYNFIKPFLEKILSTDDITKKINLHICFPRYVCDDIDYYKQELISRKKLVEKILCGYRILTDESNTTELDMYDMPSTILTLFKTVNFIFGIENGNTDDTLYAKQKAINNFYDNLKILITNDYKIKKFIYFEFIDENEIN